MSMTPLHTRMISLRLLWGAPGSIIADGKIFDLRKRGMIPLGGQLSGPGVIHEMAVRLELAYPSLQIRSMQPTMSAFPFAACSATRGEGCPDRMPDVQRLLGASLRQAWGTVLTQEIGGPLGCFHIFTLLRLLGPTIEAVVDREQSRRPGQSGAVAGNPMFARSIIMDGMKGEGFHITMRGVLCDLYYRPDANALPLEDEMEESFETTAELEIELPHMAIVAASGRVRRSGPGVDSLEAWVPVPRMGDLAGQTVVKGYTAEVQQIFAGSSGLEPVQHLLFMMGPAILQSVPSMAEELEIRPQWVQGLHPAMDSCHMFRTNGPLVTPQGNVG
jgi:Protein of unknown function (DUF2889)